MSVRTNVLVGSLALGCVISPWSYGDHHMEMQFVPAHINVCSFRDGKDWGDLDKLNEEFAEFVGEEGTDYSYWILTPRFREDSEMHFAWLGSWNSGAGFGAGFDNWAANAGKLEQMFADTADCGSNMMAITPIVADPENGPTDGVVWFSRCTLEDDKGLGDAVAAHAKGSAAMMEMGVQAQSWAFLPVLGFGDAEHDYYHVATFDSYTGLGAGFDANFNMGGWKARAESMDGVASCASPNLYDFRIKMQGQQPE